MPTPSAFSEDEIAVLSEWVEAGGSLLLVFEHMPLAGAAQDLAGAFGIEISNGFVVDGTSLADAGPGHYEVDPDFRTSS